MFQLEATIQKFDRNVIEFKDSVTGDHLHAVRCDDREFPGAYLGIFLCSAPTSAEEAAELYDGYHPLLALKLVNDKLSVLPMKSYGAKQDNWIKETFQSILANHEISKRMFASLENDLVPSSDAVSL